MMMMIDTACCQCGRRFGWSGTVRDMPACPRCGFRRPQAELDAAADRMEADQKRMRTHPGRASADMRRQQRIDAGLTLRQAAKLLDVTPTVLSATEQGSYEPSAELCSRMAKAYGVGL